MMYPVAVNGQMVFVDHKQYRDNQIKKVIAKHRARHSSGPDKYSLEKSIVHHKNAKSMPHLYNNGVLSPKVGRPRFNSMPSLDSQPKIEDEKQEHKASFIKYIKELLLGKKKSKKTSKKYSPIYQSNSNARVRPHGSAPVDILCKSRADVNSESNSPPGVSPKRQRMRTVSNISSIMETIDEIPENLVLEDETDSDSSSENGSSVSINTSYSEPISKSNAHLLKDNNHILILHSSTELVCSA